MKEFCMAHPVATFFILFIILMFLDSAIENICKAIAAIRKDRPRPSERAGLAFGAATNTEREWKAVAVHVGRRINFRKKVRASMTDKSKTAGARVVESPAPWQSKYLLEVNGVNVMGGDLKDFMESVADGVNRALSGMVSRATAEKMAIMLREMIAVHGDPCRSMGAECEAVRNAKDALESFASEVKP